jgi:hypothetical protein
VLRPTEEIWNYPEREEPVPAGQRRPLLVLDEQTVHLSHTDRVLDGAELLRRVQAIITAYDVPLHVEHRPACWQSDRGETRPRIIASLRDHDHSDFKMILGVDYMGRWASIKMYLAVEPPVIPPTDPPKPPPPFFPIPLMVLAGVGVLCLIPPVTLLGLALLVLAAFLYVKMRDQHKERQRNAQLRYEMEVQRQKEELEEKAQSKNLFRTYKIDDMRLFCSAMTTVFQAVVDDIVQQEGARVERIEGGKGSFLTEEGFTRLAPAPRQSDAGKDFGL